MDEDYCGFEPDDLEVFNQNEAGDYGHEDCDYIAAGEDEADGDVFYNDPDND